ncbi:MAG: alpha/beta hydrolase [Planctomycetaceae bacterium]
MPGLFNRLPRVSLLLPLLAVVMVPLLLPAADKPAPSAAATIRKALKARGVQVRRATPETVSGDQAIKVHTDLVYARYGDRSLALDLFEPPPTGRSRPGILVVHGGGWLKGDKQKFHALAKALALRGYVAAAVGYRLGGEARFPAAVHDCNAATRWLRANAARFAVDPKRIGAVGGSAGGHLVGLMAAAAQVKSLQGQGGHPDRSSRLQAAVVLAGPMQLATGSVARKSREQPDASNANKWFGKTVDEAPALYRLGAPFTHFSAATPPMFFLRGQFDSPAANVPAREKLTRLKVTSIARVYHQGRHGCWNQHPWFDVMVDDIDEFLADSLGDPDPVALHRWTRWLSIPGVDVFRGRDRVELVVGPDFSGKVLQLPRLNNPVRHVELIDPGVRSGKPQKLKLISQVNRWDIPLPESSAAGPRRVRVATVGRPWVSKLPRVVSPKTAASSTIVLAAHDAVAVGKMLRYEPLPHKNTLGYWVNVKDWCWWQVYIERPGRYEIVVFQGCGKGHGGSRVAVSLAGQSREFTVEDTGGFQAFRNREIGGVTIERPGLYRLEVRPRSKARVAVMDVRRIVLNRSGDPRAVSGGE